MIIVREACKFDPVPRKNSNNTKKERKKEIAKGGPEKETPQRRDGRTAARRHHTAHRDFKERSVVLAVTHPVCM